jgi:uncharacterized OB-fold protein
MTIYTETVVQGAEPYQIAIVTREDGTRVTGRIEGERVAIDDEVVESGMRDGVPFFRKA